MLVLSNFNRDNTLYFQIQVPSFSYVLHTLIIFIEHYIYIYPGS